MYVKDFRDLNMANIQYFARKKQKCKYVYEPDSQWDSCLDHELLFLQQCASSFVFVSLSCFKTTQSSSVHECFSQFVEQLDF